MEFTVDKKSITDALKFLSKFKSASNTLQLSVKNDKLFIVSESPVYVKIVIPVKKSSKGRVFVSEEIFHKVATLTGKEVSCHIERVSFIVKCGRTTIQIPTIERPTLTPVNNVDMVDLTDTSVFNQLTSVKFTQFDVCSVNPFYISNKNGLFTAGFVDPFHSILLYDNAIIKKEFEIAVAYSTIKDIAKYIGKDAKMSLTETHFIIQSSFFFVMIPLITVQSVPINGVFQLIETTEFEKEKLEISKDTLSSIVTDMASVLEEGALIEFTVHKDVLTAKINTNIGSTTSEYEVKYRGNKSFSVSYHLFKDVVNSLPSSKTLELSFTEDCHFLYMASKENGVACIFSTAI